MDWRGKRYWLVGASEGLGAALAQKISAAGAEVIVSARNAARLDEVVAGLPGRARAVPMDVQDADSVAEAARAGFRGLPGAIGYAASKAATMSLAESMRADLWRSGVRVQLANPGFIKTRLTDKNQFRMPFIMTPEAAAQEMFELMCDEAAFQRNFPRLFSYVFRLSRFLPDWVYYRLFA